MAEEYLDIVDENDQVIGRELRSVVHEQGLLYRGVHVWFITPDDQIILQKRSMSKDVNPGLIISTVAGHVGTDIGYLDAATRETYEETGITVRPEDLIFIDKIKSYQECKITGRINNVIRCIYWHSFAGNLEDLRVEDGDGAGFISMPLADFITGGTEVHAMLVPIFFDHSYAPIWPQLQKMVKTAHNGPVSVDGIKFGIR